MTDDPHKDLYNLDGTRMQEYPTDIELRMNKAGTTNWRQRTDDHRYKADRQKNPTRGGFHVRNGRKA